MIINHDINFKFLDSKKLADLLHQLPEGSVVSPNAIGNMAIYTEENGEFTCIGYIDFLFDGDIEYI